jgi:hypothetical protein
MARKEKPIVLHKDWTNNLSIGALENIQVSINDGCVSTSIYVVENKNKIDQFIKSLGRISRNNELSTETQFWESKKL